MKVNKRCTVYSPDSVDVTYKVELPIQVCVNKSLAILSPDLIELEPFIALVCKALATVGTEVKDAAFKVHVAVVSWHSPLALESQVGQHRVEGVQSLSVFWRRW